MSVTRYRTCVRALCHVVVLVCTTLLWSSAPAHAAHAAPVAPQFYGVNSGSTLVSDAAARPAALQAMRAGGLSFVRVDASWGGIEPAAPVAGVHSYVWSTYDAFVADLARSGLRWYPMLGYSAPWASTQAGDPFAPPARDTDFATFAPAFAGRYGAGGTFWGEHPELPALPVTVYGIWNEPSNPHFWHGADATPARYMRLYLAARAAIRSVDAGARVATAGLLDSGVIDGTGYLRAMLDSAPAAIGQIDAVGWHPYVGNLDQTLASVRSARSELDIHGLPDVPIELSEIGWWRTGGFTPAQRASTLRGLAATLPYAGLKVSRLLPYVWTGDPEWQITELDGSLGEVGGAYFAGIRDARAPRPASTSSVRERAAAKRIGKLRNKSRLSARIAARTRARQLKTCTARSRVAASRRAGAAPRCSHRVGAKRQQLSSAGPFAL